MNRYARDYLKIRSSRDSRDGRNPYGSRGGYVRDSRDYRDRDYRDRDMDYRDRRERDMNDMRYGRDSRRDNSSKYDSRQDYRDYTNMDSRDYMDNEQFDQYDRDYEDMRGGRGNYRPIEAMGYFNGYYEDGRDYYDGHEKLSKKDIKKWEKELKNADGTKGKKWETEQIEKSAKQVSVTFDEYSPEVFAIVVNMLYADYCKVLGGDMMLYVRLAKAFLEDDDFEGEPEEKVMLYYKCIVEKDEQ